jgi:hypothetical protein
MIPACRLGRGTGALNVRFMAIHPVAFIRFPALLALLFAMAGCEKAPVTKPAPPAAEAAARPHLVFSAADIPAIKAKAGKGWPKEAHAVMMAQADASAANPTLAYGGEGSENRTLQSFYALGLAGQMTGDLKYAQGGAKTLLALVRQMDPDADFKTHPEIGTMATVVALGYDFFHAAMTPAERQEVEAEIRQYGACIYRRANAEIWGKDDRLHLVHNWTGVIFPGLGLCALALDEHPEWLELATLRVKQHFDHCADAKGATWESVAYMDYGLMNAAPFAEALRRKTGRDLVAESAPVQNLLKHIVTIQFPWKAGMVAFNQGSDATLGMCDHGGYVYLLSRTRDAAGFHAWSHLMGFAFPPGKLTPYSLDTSNLGALVLWGDPAMPSQSPQEAGYPLTTHYEERGLAVLRDGWGEDDALVTLIAGKGVHGCWNHADNNSFTFAARGEMFAIDRGSFTRVNGKKIPKREPWDHNVVLVDGMGYKFVKGSQSVPGELVRVKDLGGATLATGDVVTAFAEPFEKAERSVFLVRGPQPVLIVVDDIQKDAAEHEFTWLMHTGLENKIEVDAPTAAARITGSRKGGVCDVRVLWPQNALVSQIEARDQSDNAIIAATARAVNPRFVSILTARAANEKAVTVAAEGDPETGMTLRLTYADGSVKSIELKQADISLKTVDENHPQISFALERLNTALASTGAKATTREADLKPGDFLVALADDASQAGAESGSYVIRTRPDGTHLVLGNDATGALYGCLHAARLAAAGQASFDISESPAFRYRGVAVPMQLMELIYDGVFYDFPITRENFPFFYDQAHWNRVLDMLVENRMNVLYLWNGHPFTSLLPMDKYPDAREVSPEQ